jgi:hypothetical protein
MYRSYIFSVFMYLGVQYFLSSNKDNRSVCIYIYVKYLNVFLLFMKAKNCLHAVFKRIMSTVYISLKVISDKKSLGSHILLDSKAIISILF